TAVKKGYSQNLLLEAGLILPGNTKGSFYDRFRGRVMFPIIDLHGDCVAFGGRILGDGEPKYLNSPETDIYKKGRVLYGLNLTRGQLRGNEPALLVEGYMDLIALYKYGFNTAVASLGTALTEEQARLLKRFTKEVIFIYDGDEAGQKAMLRGCEVLLAQSLSVKIVVLPESEDPDTFLDKKGAAGFQSLIEKRMDFLDFFIETGRRDFNIRTPEGKIAVLDMLKPILDRIHHPILFNDYTFRIAEGIGLEQRLVIQHIRAKNAGVKKTADEAIQKHAKEKIPPLELFLVRILLDNPELCPKAQETLELEWVSSSVLRGFISRYLSEAQESSDFISIEENASEEEASLLREATFISSPLPNASPEELLRINLERLKISHKRRHRRHLVQEV
ncbi:MAG TPA: toprim domain-containing protein, partial [Candidatus Sumerlaeota bacterium]|nr:toprim domain-containing protein [Candidatus Sumerlaeota bacterium]